jgi:hypothetical protein
MIKINNSQSNDRDDWRFMGQDEYLMGAKLIHQKYCIPKQDWDHDHCEFCSAKFSELEGDLHEGYCTVDKNYWICEKCFNDFCKMFEWASEGKE